MNKFKVTLNNIEWNIEDSEGNYIGPVELSPSYTQEIFAHDKQEALQKALDSASDESGWLIDSCCPTIILL